MGDEVIFFVQVEAMGAASITLVLCGYRGEEPILAMRLVMVTTSITETRAVTIPVDLRNAVETYMEKCRQ